MIQKRMLTGKKVRMTAEEREEIVQKKHEERDTFEKAHLGKYKMIYPCDNIERMQAYAEF